MYLRPPFFSSASARCAVAHVRLRWRRRRRLVAVGENFLFSSLAWQLGRRKGVFSSRHSPAYKHQTRQIHFFGGFQHLVELIVAQQGKKTREKKQAVARPVASMHMTKTAKNGERSGSIGFGDAAALAYASIAMSTTRHENLRVFYCSSRIAHASILHRDHGNDARFSFCLEGGGGVWMKSCTVAKTMVWDRPVCVEVNGCACERVSCALRPSRSIPVTIFLNHDAQIAAQTTHFWLRSELP